MRERLIVSAVLLVLFVGWLALKQENTSQEASQGASIGSAFTLTDQHNKPFSSERLKGKHALVFFGFTHCPGICPMTMQTITQAYRSLKPEVASQVSLVFISVDPERDTPEAITTYLSGFDAPWIGLTGDKANIDAVVAGYRIYANKKEDAQSEGGYTMDHSAFIYMMDPEGVYIQHFRDEDGTQKIADAISKTVL